MNLLIGLNQIYIHTHNYFNNNHSYETYSHWNSMMSYETSFLLWRRLIIWRYCKKKKLNYKQKCILSWLQIKLKFNEKQMQNYNRVVSSLLW